jgi:hypothetical protein
MATLDLRGGETMEAKQPWKAEVELGRYAKADYRSRYVPNSCGNSDSASHDQKTRPGNLDAVAFTDFYSGCDVVH